VWLSLQPERSKTLSRAQTEINCRTKKRLSVGARDDIYRMADEALRNAFRRAPAPDRSEIPYDT
jgi:signal transduction histidine kinase